MMINDSHVDKKPLDLDLYEKYEIPQDYMAYVITFTDIDQMQCDELEHEYYTKGYKIFHTDIQRSTGALFIYKLIVGKASFVFSGPIQKGN